MPYLKVTKFASCSIFEKHCISRTCFFQVKKCDDPNCTFYKPTRSDHSIDTFPDPIPHEVDGILHYQPGIDEEEKFPPSTLKDVVKRPHDIPFNPSSQTAKNVGFIVKCEECNKSRLLHAKHKLKANDLERAKRMISTVAYMCGSFLSEYMRK